MKTPVTIKFNNSYAKLPERFFSRLPPTPVPKPSLIKINKELAEKLGLNAKDLSTKYGLDILAGNIVPEGAEPIAMAYAGHQFGNWVPQLGDGRAILLGEVIDKTGVRCDIQLKGSGITPYSRMGDGRAALGPILREYIVSEAMHALGIRSTRTLAAVRTGKDIFREKLLPGAILTRIAQSHVRVGTFQFFASRGDLQGLKALADHIIHRLYPEVKESTQPYLSFLKKVVLRQAQLISSWQLVGFIHGVMNTDNMSIAGETIDYGPCAFMDIFHPETVFSSIDQMGRYSYKNQPLAAHWNLACFADTLLPLISPDEDIAIECAQSAINNFTELFDRYYLEGLRKKLGLFTAHEDDQKLAQSLLSCMEENKVDFTLAFRLLSTLKKNISNADAEIYKIFNYSVAFESWLSEWRNRINREQETNADRTASMISVNPAFIPRNHLIEEVIESATIDNSLKMFNALLQVLKHPYKDQPDKKNFFNPPRPEQIVKATFCGT